MENALLIGLSRQMTLRRDMEVHANNMANINTPGYKRGTLLFEEFLMPVARMSDASGQDARISFVLDTSIYRDFAAGAFEQTGNELDVAIEGDGWFVVQTPDGERYTRNGQLKLDAAGQLVTPAGLPVLGTGGPIVLPLNETSLEIAKDGTISTNQGVRGQLRIVRFQDNAALKKQAGQLFSTTQAPEPALEAKVHQGMVEKSNVEPVVEMTQMIETMRAYQSVTRAIQNTDELRREAIGRLGGAREA
ncbi:MAG: flagellar basal-body rod protein FlgF [Methyloligellaceae bacterium]